MSGPLAPAVDPWSPRGSPDPHLFRKSQIPHPSGTDNLFARIEVVFRRIS